MEQQNWAAPGMDKTEKQASLAFHNLQEEKEQFVQMRTIKYFYKCEVLLITELGPKLHFGSKQFKTQDIVTLIHLEDPSFS